MADLGSSLFEDKCIVRLFTRIPLATFALFTISPNYHLLHVLLPTAIVIIPPLFFDDNKKVTRVIQTAAKIATFILMIGGVAMSLAASKPILATYYVILIAANLYGWHHRKSFLPN